MLNHVGLARHHRLFGHPDQHRFDCVGCRRDIARLNNHIASTGIHFVFKCQSDSQRREGFFHAAIESDDVFDMRRLLAWHDHHLVTLADDSGRDRATEAAEVKIWSIDPLNRHPEVLQISVGSDVDGFEPVHQRAAVVPRHVLAAIHYVVAVQCRQRNEVEVRQIQTLRKRAVVGTDFVVSCLIKIDEVHLVDGDDHVANAEQRNDKAVTFGLSHHAVSGVDQNDGQVGGAGSGGHVASVLFVAGSVRNNEFAFGRAEVAIGHVDRDALLAFFFQPISCQ